jgi:hypothetical protein
MMYDYWLGVGTPFFNRIYAHFCLSLPRLALEDRRLQKLMFRRYYPKVAAIPGTYGPLPLILSKGHLVKAGIASLFPKAMRRGPLRQFAPIPNTFEADCVKKNGRTALWPVYEAWDQLTEWFDMDEIHRTLEQALAGEPRAHVKYMPLQAVAYRLL